MSVVDREPDPTPSSNGGFSGWDLDWTDLQPFRKAGYAICGRVQAWLAVSLVIVGAVTLIHMVLK